MPRISSSLSQESDGKGGIGVQIEELSARLRFNPDEAQIWLEGERMVLLHLGAFGTLRRELIDRLGMETARAIIQRMGHASGAIDATLALNAKPDADIRESFMAGPRLHAIEGMVAVEPVRLEVDPETGFHSGEWVWRNSAEVEAHLRAYGVSAQPVCWALIAYASAFTSAFMGRPILYREVECKAMGAPHCRIVGGPAELWQDGERDDLHLGIDVDAVPEWHDSAWHDIHRPPHETILWPSDRLVGASPDFAAMMHQVDRVAPTQAPVMLLGEPGVGKKSCARLIHQRSNRAGKPLVAFNCAALTGEQLDNELFGVEKTGSTPGRQGRIERANGGTLFLEDVHRLEMRAQARLLRMMQTKEVERGGSGTPRPVDVRIVASSNNGLSEAVRSGTFREDLYYRLAVFPIPIPPLRERRSDIPLLIRHFVGIYAQRYGKTLAGLTSDAIGYLLTHEFPGNIAELESMIERATIMACDGRPIAVNDLASPADFQNPRFYGLSDRGVLISKLQEGEAQHDEVGLDKLLESKFNLETFESQLIERAVRRAGGNLSKAAKSLGLTRPQLAYRYRKVAGEP